MLSFVDYQALLDFSGLALIRETCASHAIGFNVENLPPLDPTVLRQVHAVPAGARVFKNDMPGDNKSTEPTIAPMVDYIHRLSHEIFKNLSHALELPWERYLGEMHEFRARGQDELQIMQPNDPITNSWSTLTIIANLAFPHKATILYGNALSVLSEEYTSCLKEANVDPILLPSDSGLAAGNWLVYYVRPNDDVYYTRTAGALMTPLTSEEYESRKRVREIKFLA